MLISQHRQSHLVAPQSSTTQWVQLTKPAFSGGSILDCEHTEGELMCLSHHQTLRSAKVQLTCNSDILLRVTELAGSSKTPEKFLFYRKNCYTSKRFGILLLCNVGSTRQAVAIQDTTPSVCPVHRMHYIHYFTAQAKCRACP